MDGRTTHVQVGEHRLAATVFGERQPAVVIEPAFGGSAQSWTEIAEALAAETTVVTYDRAPYGTSSRAHDRRPAGEIARDLHAVLDALAIARPVVLVGHSAGGVYVRAFAGAYGDEVAGMVLVDSAHEAQAQVLRGRLPWRLALSEALTLPMLCVLRRKHLNGADRRSIIRELRASNRLTAADQPLAPGGLGDKPLVVLTRGPGDEAPVHPSWHLWHGLHAELARLSANRRHTVGDKPGHYIHRDDPALVLAAIRDVLSSARTQTALAAP